MMPHHPISSDRLMILMAVYNGADTLNQQLESLQRQTFKEWDLTVADDGSTDESLPVLETFSQDKMTQGHTVTLRAGPCRGFAENFLTLLAELPQDPGYVALADQDDVWLPQKLSRALAQLDHVPADRPALYCSRRYIWSPDENDRRVVSRNYPRTPGFANALVENIAPGNTIVLNPAAARVARTAARARPTGIFAHDWWLYLVLTGVGGEVVFDPEPTLLYRQHGSNVLGAGENASTHLRNKLKVLKGAFAHRVAGNLNALDVIEPMLTAENRRCLALFRQARKVALPQRVALLRQAGVYRQGRASNIGFWGAACLGLA